jgi:hypothetical protein
MHDETYKIIPPVMSAHNLIIGQVYVDIGGKCYINNLNNKEKIVINLYKRGWTGKTAYKFVADIYNNRGIVVYKLEGRWDKECYLVDLNTGERELLWTKLPYHP